MVTEVRKSFRNISAFLFFPRPVISSFFTLPFSLLCHKKIGANAILLLEFSLTRISAIYPLATNIQAHINLYRNCLPPFCFCIFFLFPAEALICLINPLPVTAPHPVWHRMESFGGFWGAAVLMQACIARHVLLHYWQSGSEREREKSSGALHYFMTNHLTSCKYTGMCR